jgi:hypothetical protein
MTLLLFLTLLLAPQEENELAKKGMSNLMDWWNNPKLCKELNIEDSLRARIGKELDNLQTTYQLTQSQLNEARKRQTKMLFDPKLSKAELEKFNREQVVPLSDRMQATNFAARLLVRSMIDPSQLKTIENSHPQFFTSRWFKTTKVPIRQGKVIIKKP